MGYIAKKILSVFPFDSSVQKFFYPVIAGTSDGINTSTNWVNTVTPTESTNSTNALGLIDYANHGVSLLYTSALTSSNNKWGIYTKTNNVIAVNPVLWGDTEQTYCDTPTTDNSIANKKYVDDNIAAIPASSVTQEDVDAILEQAETFTTDAIATAITDSESYADTKDTASLTVAKDYADTKDAITLVAAKSYVDSKSVGTANTIADGSTLNATTDVSTLNMLGQQISLKSSGSQFKFNIYFNGISTPWTDHATYQDANNYDRLLQFGSDSWVNYLNNAGVKKIQFKQKPQIDITSYTPTEDKDVTNKSYVDAQITSVANTIPSSNSISNTIDAKIITATASFISSTDIDAKDTSILSQAKNYTDTQVTGSGNASAALSSSVSVASSGTNPNSTSTFNFAGQSFNKSFNVSGTDISIKERVMIGAKQFINSYYISDTSSSTPAYSLTLTGITGGSFYALGVNVSQQQFYTFNVIPSCGVAPTSTTHLTNKQYVDDASPIGSRTLWSSSITLPTGYLECNGASYNTTTYATLYALLGSSNLPSITAPSGNRYIIRAA